VPGRADAQDRLVVGPWTHHPRRARVAGPMVSHDETAWQVDRLQLAHLDPLLRGADQTDSAAVRVAVMNSAAVWEGASWPPPEAKTVTMFLGSRGTAAGVDGGGVLTTDAGAFGSPDHLVYDHGDPPPALGGDDCGDPDLVGMGPADQATVEWRPDVLVYTSPKATRPCWYVGGAEVSLFVASVDAAAQWLVRLCVVTATGVSVNIAEAISRGRSDSDPGSIELSLGPVAFQRDKHERLRLHVTQGSSPRWAGLRDGTGALTVTRSILLHDEGHPSRLQLAQLH
jgi:putative CocE/NonD family hydrolase